MNEAAELGSADTTPDNLYMLGTFRLAPNVLLIPGTSSVRHLEENLAAADIELQTCLRVRLTYDVDPANFGIACADHTALAGGDASGNADIVHKTFAGASGPIR